MLIMKHAYLILAHNQPKLLQKLLACLDDENNDIYIHIDKKNKDIDISSLSGICTRSIVTVIKKYKVQWGSMSIVKAELALLKLSVPYNYDFYHFISGVDYPIKSQKYIQDFYEQNKGKNFLMFCTDEMNEYHKTRYMYYYFGVKRHNNTFTEFFYNIFNKLSLFTQKRLKIDRNKGDIKSYYGSQWCDITNNFATYLVANEKVIFKRFNHTYIPDESVFHSMLVYGGFLNTLYSDKKISNDANMREIDWERGSPYTFKEEDYNMLINSNHLFARKFDYEKHPEIIDKLTDYIK